MIDIVLPATETTPEVNFNGTTGRLQISGTAMPENVFIFFNPLFDWLNEYKNHPCSKTMLEFNMDYFNTSSEIFILRLIKGVAQLKESGKEVRIIWYYKEEDDEMKYTGKYLGKLGKVNMELISMMV